MLKKILISALIAIGLVSGSVVRGQNTGGDKGQHQTTNEKRGRRRPTTFTSFTHVKQKRGRRRGTLIRKAGGEQERRHRDDGGRPRPLERKGVDATNSC